MQKYELRYKEHRKRARQSGIGFLLTFDEWLKLWMESGCLHLRGCRKGQYVMARNGDKGPYAIGNVRITTVETNHSEKRHTPETIAKLRIANLGKKNATYGRRHTPAERRKMSLAKKGKPLSEEHRSKISVAVTKSWHRSRGLSR